MSVEIALYQPEIALNTGTLLRLGACLGVRVHIIHPTSFHFSRAAMKRSGMDYLDHADFVEHASFSQFESWALEAGKRLVLLTTKASQSAYAVTYSHADILLLGRESSGVPEAVAQRADLRVRIPMKPDLRSINVSLAATLVIGEAMRQTAAFETLI